MKKIILQRAAALLLILVMLAGVAPVSFAGTDSVIPALMRRFDSRVAKPREASILDEPVKMTVRSRFGNLIYVCSSPSGVVLNNAPEGASVIVYARQSGYALGLVENTVIGGG